MEEIREFLPLIIIFILYALSGLFKGKKKPGGTAGRKPRTAPPPGRKRTPSYARKKEEVSRGPAEVGQRASPVPRKVARQESAGGRETEVRPAQAGAPGGGEIGKDRVRTKPTSTGPSRPKQTGTIPRSMGDRRVRKSKRVSRPIEQVPAGPHASRPRGARTVAPAVVERASAGRKRTEGARRPARSVHEVVQRHHQQVQAEVSSRPLAAFERFEQRLSGRSALAQAILHTEILGKCMALRSGGSHDYSSLM